MSSVYTWKVEQMESYVEKDGFQNVVFSVNWRVVATDGNHSATVYDRALINIDLISEFTPYEDLTNDQVIGWVKSGMGDEAVAEIENLLNSKILSIKEPSTSILSLPWDN